MITIFSTIQANNLDPEKIIQTKNGKIIMTYAEIEGTKGFVYETHEEGQPRKMVGSVSVVMNLNPARIGRIVRAGTMQVDGERLSGYFVEYDNPDSRMIYKEIEL